jgi:hypothetical protein
MKLHGCGSPAESRGLGKLSPAAGDSSWATSSLLFTYLEAGNGAGATFVNLAQPGKVSAIAGISRLLTVFMMTMMLCS